ncbi:N/A [soil metagenome]
MQRLAVVFMCMAASFMVAHAQGGATLDIDKLQAAQKGSVSQILSSEQVPVDNVIDPKIYRVGPGDVIAYQMVSMDFSEKLASVTPENALLLDRYGMINVQGLTLAQVRDSIVALIHRRIPGVDCFVTLRRPRLVYVTLRGNVPYPGTYAVPASMRVSTLLNVARQPWLLRKDVASNELGRNDRSTQENSRLQELTRATGTSLSPFASRNIIVRHRDGVSNVDLPKAMLPGFAALDPHVREGDEVIVPYDNASAPSISISGAVADPVTIAYKSGDRASLLLAAAGGPTSDADLTRVVVVDPSGRGKRTISVDSTMHIVGEDPVLEPGSTIVVEQAMREVVAGGQGVINVFGEVRNPGSMVIAPGVTKLTEILSRCGGITADASMSLAYVVRPEQGAFGSRDQQADIYRRFQYSDLTLEDTVRYRLDMEYRLPFVSSDFRKAYADSNSPDNIVLYSGDIVVVPRVPDRVFVYGQVNQPGYVSYVAKKTMEWYIERAGGYAQGAKPSRARVIKGKTKVWVDDDDAMVDAGDEVYVPRAPDVSTATQIQTYAVIAGVTSAIAALIATFYAILRK